LSSSTALSPRPGLVQRPEPVPRAYWISLALWIAFTATIVTIVGVLLRLATDKYDFSEPKLRESMAFTGKHLDVAFFGDSLTLEGVNPDVVDRKLNIESYNFALGGASILESEMQLRYFLRHNPKPHLVALGVYLNVPNKPAGVRPTLYFGLPDDLRTVFRDELFSHESVKIDRSFKLFNSIPAYRYRNTIDLLLKSLLSHDDQRPSFVKGQARVSFSRDPLLGRKHESVFKADELESFMDFCEKERIPVLLFEPPNHPGYSELTVNRAEILEKVSRLAMKYPHARFVSFNGTFALGQAEWVNLNHLNIYGSATFSDLLSTALVSDFSSR